MKYETPEMEIIEFSEEELILTGDMSDDLLTTGEKQVLDIDTPKTV